MSDWRRASLWLVVLLAVNAFFVGAEFAVISARRSQIEPLAEPASAAAKTTLWAMEHATLMLATTPARHHRLLAADPQRLRARDPPPAGGPARHATGWSADVDRHDRVRRRAGAGHRSCTWCSARWCRRTSRSRCPTGPRCCWRRRWSWIGARVPAGHRRAERHARTRVLRLFGVEPKDEATSTFTLDEVADDREPVHPGGRADRPHAARSPPRSSSPTKKVARRRGAARRAGLAAARPRRRPTCERAVAKHGFSRYVARRRRRRADRLPAPQGRARPGRRPRFDAAGAGQADPPAGHGVRGQPTSRTRWPPCAAPGSTWPASVDDERHDRRRAVPGGHHRGARRRGAGRDAPVCNPAPR